MHSIIYFALENIFPKFVEKIESIFKQINISNLYDNKYQKNETENEDMTAISLKAYINCFQTDRKKT